jgi:hypothetical protein
LYGLLFADLEYSYVFLLQNWWKDMEVCKDLNSLIPFCGYLCSSPVLGGVSAIHGSSKGANTLRV